MEENRKKKIKGLKISLFNACTVSVAAILCIILAVVTVVISRKQKELILYTDDYIALEKDAAMLGEASDCLTEQVRLYAENMDIKYAENYFEEANVTRRRETALEELEAHNPDEKVLKSLESALQSSNSLMEREIYSMRLISEANDYSLDLLPSEIRDTELKKEDLKLTPEEQIKKARDLVFNEGYQDAKALINTYLSYFTEGIISETASNQTESEAAFSRAVSFQRVLTLLLLILYILTFTVVTCLIVRPLHMYIQYIQRKELLPVIGAYECQYLADTYNTVYEMNAANEALLKHTAEHDPLTGVLNRAAFHQIRKPLEESSIPLAMLLIDIDRFKQVNDRYGHETGDEILKKVAGVLKKSFRTSDYVIRMGGDEFALIMTEVTEEHKETILKKVERMNHFLKNPTDGSPSVSLSVGVSFSPKGYTEELYGEADRALYQVKEHGRCGCSFSADPVPDFTGSDDQ